MRLQGFRPKWAQWTRTGPPNQRTEPTRLQGEVATRKPGTPPSSPLIRGRPPIHRRMTPTEEDEPAVTPGVPEQPADAVEMADGAASADETAPESEMGSCEGVPAETDDTDAAAAGTAPCPDESDAAAAEKDAASESQAPADGHVADGESGEGTGDSVSESKVEATVPDDEADESTAESLPEAPGAVPESGGGGAGRDAVDEDGGIPVWMIRWGSSRMEAKPETGLLARTRFRKPANPARTPNRGRRSRRNRMPNPRHRPL